MFTWLCWLATLLKYVGLEWIIPKYIYRVRHKSVNTPVRHKSVNTPVRHKSVNTP